MTRKPFPDPDLHPLPDRMPDLFVLGGPKCGTTSLHAWLSQHPDVYMPAKEPNFLSRDVFDARGIPAMLADWDAYLDRLAPPAKAGKLTGDFTPRTLYSDLALDILADHPAAPRLIVLLRNPIDLVFSLHGQMLRQGVERETDFARAWEAAKARGSDPDAWRDSAGRIDRRLDYPMYGRLGTRLQKWQARVPSDRIRILVLEEDLRHTPDRVFSDILDFLGLAPQEVDLALRNERVELRSVILNRTLVQLREGVMRMRAAVGLPVQARSTGLMKFINYFNMFKVSGAPGGTLSATLRRNLAAEFADEVTRVEEALGRPVPAWRDWSTAAEGCVS